MGLVLLDMVQLVAMVNFLFFFPFNTQHFYTRTPDSIVPTCWFPWLARIAIRMIEPGTLAGAVGFIGTTLASGLPALP